MAQTFPNITALKAFIDQYLVPNGMREIDGQELNDVTNSLADFILLYQLNSGLVDVQSGSAPFTAGYPITVFNGQPSSVTVPGNIQNLYVFVNATGLDIPFNTPFSYYDLYENEQTSIPLRQAIWIAKAENGNWVQINNLSGGGSGADLPPQTGNAGKFLSTNGTSALWNPPSISITSADFDNATECTIPNAQYNSLSVYWSDAANFIYESNGDWEYLPGNTGIKILVPGFDATSIDYHFEIFLKPLNT